METENLTLRPEVLAFATLMELRLREKDEVKQRSWKAMSETDLTVHAVSKAMRLETAVRSQFQDRARYAVDLANYGMMIADVTGALEGYSGANASHIIFCINACEGIPDTTLKSWLNPPEGLLGAPHGTWARQLSAAGARLVELVSMLETLCNGLAWNIENHPDVMNEADNEALQAARKLLFDVAGVLDASKTEPSQDILRIQV